MISPKTLKNPCLSEIVTSGLPSTMILDVRVLLNPVSNVALFAVVYRMSSDRLVSLKTLNATNFFFCHADDDSEIMALSIRKAKGIGSKLVITL